ncbi:MAG: lytic murein transglycosylase [Halofilum sp. (in: g-proteobacteria)]|nr:lytic murein transglycosylase [Halofilum sp. (in: g-proteobacteria)]
MIRTGTLLRLVLFLALLGLAGGRAVAGSDFAACVATLGDQAKRAGISPAVVEASLAGIERQERVIELDRGQPEFVTTFADYFDHRVTERRVERGRELLEEHERLLDRVYRDYGVPPRYLVAFWGLETNYGSYFGRMPVLDSIATLACDERRSEFFTTQLIAALRIIDEGAISPRRMQGSWAGAMGHVQFMPSVFLKYAVDYDGDGRRDLWGSLPDAMASAANYLSDIGWETGWRWGREVRLPENFPYHYAGRDQWRPLDEWRELGVRDAYGRKLAGGDIEAALLVPQGHAGPAFLVYPNFEVIMRWNRSQLYALAVGRLADRLAGATTLVQQPPEGPRLRREQVAALQEHLKAKGFDSGPIDGIPGPLTRQALRAYQQTQGMVADGYPSPALLAHVAPQLAEASE